jgi:glycosyltransferase involved in cell wall biosynthesis
VATRGQGIDGVIVDGENGFLCPSGDAEEMAKVLRHIRSLSVQQLNEISKKAVDTAQELTDGKVAAHYLNSIIQA